MGRRWQKLGLIAGGGNLPLRLAQTCTSMGAPFVVVRLTSFADEELNAFDGFECNIAEIGKLIRTLKEQGCDSVCMAGVVNRPNFKALKPDWRGAALLPKVVAAATKGDAALLDVLVNTFESEGFVVVGADEIASSLVATAGPMTTLQPGDNDFSDMRKAADLVNVLGPFDIGQGTVVRAGHVLAVEAAEGTDKMLQRCAELPEALRNLDDRSSVQQPTGILLKRPKPGQELRVDLPTIGVETVLGAKKAGLAGIFVEAEAALVIDADRMRDVADREGLFVYGFTAADLLN